MNQICTMNVEKQRKIVTYPDSVDFSRLIFLEWLCVCSWADVFMGCFLGEVSLCRWIIWVSILCFETSNVVRVDSGFWGTDATRSAVVIKQGQSWLRHQMWYYSFMTPSWPLVSWLPHVSTGLSLFLSTPMLLSDLRKEKMDEVQSMKVGIRVGEKKSCQANFKKWRK